MGSGEEDVLNFLGPPNLCHVLLVFILLVQRMKYLCYCTAGLETEHRGFHLSKPGSLEGRADMLGGSQQMPSSATVNLGLMGNRDGLRTTENTSILPGAQRTEGQAT